MRKRRKIGLEIFALICTVTVVVISAAPLFNRNTDAKLLLLIFGAFGAGVSMTNLIRNIRQGKKQGHR